MLSSGLLSPLNFWNVDTQACAFPIREWKGPLIEIWPFPAERISLHNMAKQEYLRYKIISSSTHMLRASNQLFNLLQLNKSWQTKITNSWENSLPLNTEIRVDFLKKGTCRYFIKRKKIAKNYHNIFWEPRDAFAPMKQDAVKDKYSMLKHVLDMKLKINLSLKD